MDNLAEKYSYEDLLNNVETDALDVDKEVETEDDTIVDSSESRKLYVDKVDKSTSDLFRMIVEGELNLQPNYQRKFVWDKKQCLSLLNLCCCLFRFQLYFGRE